MTSTTPPESPTRISPLRVVLLVLVAPAAAAAGFVGAPSWAAVGGIVPPAPRSRLAHGARD